MILISLAIPCISTGSFRTNLGPYSYLSQGLGLIMIESAAARDENNGAKPEKNGRGSTGRHRTGRTHHTVPALLQYPTRNNPSAASSSQGQQSRWKWRYNAIMHYQLRTING